MYNDNNPYEEYMRNSLGYNMNPMMNMDIYNNQMYYEDENNFTYNQTSVEDMYPEIYKIIYPMVCKACMNVQENISEDLVSRITNEIYVNVENTEVAQECRNLQNGKNTKNEVTTNNRVSSVVNDTRQETRQRNPLLRDLIRILVLRELLGRPHRPRLPFRPPFRPPFGPGPRTPFMF